MIRRSWAQTASIEATLALWAASLREIKQRIRPLFKQERVAANAGLFLEGLLGDEPRKTGWMRAEAAGDPGPWRQQAILGRRDWDADALRDIVRDYVIEHLADDDAVLVIDETGFLKQGKASCGVARQYTGSAGKITNCQIGVFAAYVSRHGHAFIDRALYLPKEWTDDPDRLEAAYVPPDVDFATKPKLAKRMIARAIAASVPFKWIAGDTVYGVGDIEQQLRRAGKGYVYLFDTASMRFIAPNGRSLGPSGLSLGTEKASGMTQAQCDVLFEKRDGIAWLTLNRPEKRNCLNIGIATHVTEHLQDCANDDEIRAVMISANGPAFCAGNDLVEFKNRLHDPVLSREFEATVGRMHESIRLSPKTVVAVVSGYCLGGGITLLGSCDLAIAADTAEFGLPELARGTWPALATTPVMHGLHRKHGLYLILTAKNVRAPEALTMGLVSQVVPAADLKKAAEEIAKTLSGYDPNVLTWAKKIAHDSLDMDYEQSFKYGGFAARTFLTETRSFQQGIGSFLRSEK